MMLFVIGLDQHTQRIDEAIARVLGIVADFVDQPVELSDRSVILTRVCFVAQTSVCDLRI